jgi:hypothetical protein
MYIFLPGGTKWRSGVRHIALIAHRWEVARSISSWVIGFLIYIILQATLWSCGRPSL